MDTNKQIEKISIEGRISNNLIYILSDVQEKLVMISEQENKRAGFKFNNREKDLMNRIKFANQDLRKVSIKIESQEEFGENADELFKLIILLQDRIGQNKDKYKIVEKFLTSLNSETKCRLFIFGIRD